MFNDRPDEAIHQAEEGENYFISMTDMMVGVRFIFIIMLMTFALDFRRTTDVQEDALKVAQEVARKLDAPRPTFASSWRAWTRREGPQQAA